MYPMDKSNLLILFLHFNFFFYITYLAKQKFVIKKIKLIVLKNLTNMYKICHEIILICVLFNAIFNIYKLFLYI